MEKKKIAILGSTGSIGIQATKVVEKSNDKEIVALAAHHNIDLLEEQARRFHVKQVAVFDEKSALELKNRLKDTDIKVSGKIEGVIETACNDEVQVVLNSVGGMIGLSPTVEAIKKGKTIALANKETLVTAGTYVMELAKRYNTPILPVDSEHSAVFQCLQNEEMKSVKHLIITASGGPFFGKTKDQLANITVEEALKHPNWAMGAKISIDSATMMNKGLELIEAVHLFDVRPDQIRIVVHRESIIHSMVEFSDNCVMAQMSVPNMELPIQYALNYPERQEACIAPLDLCKIGKLTFAEPDLNTFGCLKLAIWAAEQRGSMGAVLNGANEAAVDLFLKRKISFLDIEKLVENALVKHNNIENPDMAQLIDCDHWAREQVYQRVL
jgi:1-deoxy-D-xylulose-5-phosphate reductoisomerase